MVVFILLFVWYIRKNCLLDLDCQYSLFIIHFIIIITIGVSNLQSGKRRKEQRRKEEQEKLEQEKRIQNSRKRKIDSEQPLKVNNDANSGRVNTEMQALK